MKKKLIAVSVFIALSTILIPAIGVKALAATMPPAGNANLSTIDISHYNVPLDSNGNYQYDKINWASVKSSQKAVYIKATEGRTYTDPCYKTLAAAAQSAGVSHSFYHFFWPSATAAINTQQADYFYEAIKNLGYDCVPVLDIEQTNESSDMPALSKDKISKAVKAFADEFKSKSGRDIMIYTYNNFIDSYFDSSLSKYKLWVARYSGEVQDTSVWHSWDMWQYTNSLAVSGMPVAVDANKATGNIFLNSTSGTTWIDLPSGTHGVGDIKISGWAISYYGVSRVDIYVDGKCVGSVAKDSFSSRSDIEDKFGGAGYEDALNSGYSFSLPDGTLSSGTHSVRVASVNDRGNAIWSASKSFTVKVPEDQTGLEKPSGAYKGDVTVSGWAISRFGINRVDVYVDGKFYGSVPGNSFTARTDIATKYAGKGYNDISHSGFSYTIANLRLAAGTHVVRTAEIDNKGKAVWSSPKSFTMTAPSNRFCIDKPSGTYTGNITVSGWAISHVGINRVDIYVDGKGAGSVKNAGMTKRTDVERIYANSGYNDMAHSGFSYTIPGVNLSGGNHSVRVAVIDNSGKVIWSATKTFTVVAPSMQVNLDQPSGSYSGDIAVSGWAISHFGISRTDVYVDGKGMGSVKNADMTERTDVERIFANKGYNDMAHSGFFYNISAGTLSHGTHTIRMAVIDKSGKVFWTSPKTFTIA